MNQTLEGYTLRFWKNIFRPKYIDLVRSVQSCSVYRYVATSAKHSGENKPKIVSIWYLSGLDVFRYIPTDVTGQHLQGSADVKIETTR